MEYIPLSFLAGILTILAPCVLPILPIILGGTLSETEDRRRPFIIVLSLSLSITIFTILLRSSTILLSVDPSFWSSISGGILILYGIITIFPSIWEWIEVKLRLNALSGTLFQRGGKQEGVVGSILIGAALGPVFTSCSPTYALIVAVILPQELFVGILNLLFYSAGIAVIFGAVALGGRGMVLKLIRFADTKNYFRRILGIIFIIIGAMIMSGLDKELESKLLDIGFGNTVINIEQFVNENFIEK